jgi:metallophosphoesterase superfamily enzyme
VARVSHRGQTIERRCFAADRDRAILPAFGAFTGGLNVRHSAFSDVFGSHDFTAHMLGDGRIYAFTAAHCLGG